LSDQAQNETRIAVVTGASRGIGRAIAQQLAKDGRHVVLASRSEGPLNELREEIVAAGGQASVVTVDMSDASSVASLIEATVSEHGRLDILVNNAGITRDNLSLRMSDEEFDDVINVNLRGVFVACRAAARPMMRGRFGRIVNIGSTSGLVGNAGQANYAAAKAGVIGLTKTLAKELARFNVTVNAVAPGVIETDIVRAMSAEEREKAFSEILLGRPGRVEDVADAVSFLCGDRARFITGEVLRVDGGQYI